MKSNILKKRKTGKLARNARNINAILLILVLILVAAIAAVIIDDINNDNARNLVRANSIEAAQVFSSYINEELTLVRKAANSKAISNWCADEGHEAKKAYAFDEMLDYTVILQDAQLYLGISESRNEYTIVGRTVPEDFVPIARIDQSIIDDAWYFESVSSGNDYIMNIGLNKFTNEWQLWINHKVKLYGKTVGVFCSGLRIPDVSNQIFRNYDSRKIRGYIIDRYGVIQLASSINEAYSGEARNIRVEINAPLFIDAINSYSGLVKRFFAPQSQTVVTRLSKGTYGYAAIAPVSGTDWSVVVFYNNDFISDITYILPLLIVMLAAMLLYVVGRNALMNQLIFKPLADLTQSISEDKCDIKIYGGSRDDEIGDLARTIRDASNERYYKEQLLHAVNSAAAVLLAPLGGNDFEASLLEGIKMMGRCVDVDRVKIWRNKIVDSSHYGLVLMYEWYVSTNRQGMQIPVNTAVPYSVTPEWESKFSKGEYINGPLSGLSEKDRAYLEPYGIKSVLMIPVHLEEQFWGIVCFDDYTNERNFTEEEVNILRSGSLMIVSAMNRNIQAVKLSEAQENTQVLLDAMPLTIQLWDRECRMFDCSEESVKLFKLKNKQEIFDRFYDLSPEYQPDGQPSKEKVFSMLSKTFEDGRNVLEWMHQTIDGEPLPSEITLVRVKFGDEYVIASYVRDLREHKQMMQEIERRDFLLNTVNSAAAILIQPEIEEFERHLKECMSMIGKAVGTDRACIWENHTRDGSLFCTLIYEWLNNAEPQIGAENTIEVPYERNLSCWIEILSQRKCISNLVRNLSASEQAELGPRGIKSIFVAPVFVRDHFWGFVSFDDCHNERVFTENEQSILRSGGLIIANALLRNEMAHSISDTAAKLEAVIANYPGIIWCMDHNSVITLFNGRFLKLLGLNQSNFEGRILADVLQEYGFSGISQDIRKTFTEGSQDLNSEVNGKMYRIRTTPIYNESGVVVNVMGSFDDITERTQLQKELKEALKIAQEASEAKTKFLANMSHEMRTPLNAVIGLSGLTLDAGELSEDAKGNLEKINSAGSTLLSTVNDILDISKIEAGKFELIPVEYDTPSLINDTITQSIMRMQEKPIKFEMIIDENLPTRLYGDDLRIKQIMNNLLSNSFKYTQKGTVTLEVKCEKDSGQAADNNSVWFIVTVRDSGIGIKPENIDDLFKDYAKLDVKSHRKIEGTGLGLPITKRIADMMGGSISVESEYNKGSAFTVRLRQKFVTDAVIGMEVVNSLKSLNYMDQKRQRISKMHRLSLPYARVLVVDDVITNLDVVKGMMKPYNMKIDCVTSGQQAIDAISSEKEKYSAIFMDHMMPEMDGIEAVKIIREKIGTDYAKNIPIIALTANAIVGNEEMFLKNGFQAFISKPIEIARLDSVIREFVRNKELEEKLGQVKVSGEMVLDSRSGKERRLNASGRRKKQGRRVADRKNIEGLDFDKGLERLSGDRESYIEILRSFATNTRPLLELLKNVTEGNLPNYAITVHGIKGSCRSICAGPLGDMAQSLEFAAKAGDFNNVIQNNAVFIQKAENLIETLEEMFQRSKPRIHKPKKDKPDREELQKLINACDKYAMDDVDSALGEIEKYEYENDADLVNWLRENVNQMNFTQIIEKLTPMIN